LNESLAQTMFDTKNESGAGFENAARGVVHSLGPPDRFFSATILGGRLYVRDIPDRGPWEPSCLHWWPEDHVGLVLTTTRDRKVRTAEELEAAIEEPVKVSPTRNVWIHESLEDEAPRLWEMDRA
jgi:hypothetical protein